DIYSLGIIFYEMLTQKRPYTDETVVGILNKHTFAPVPRLPEDLAGYQDLLAARGLIGGGANPVTRTNAVPDGGSLHERSIVAAQVVRPDPGGSGGDWVLSGVAELLADGTAVAAGDLSDAGMAAKAAHVLDVVAERLAALGAGTANVVNVYCPQDLGPLYDQVAARVPAVEGASLRHWRCVPPLLGLAFEVDCRRISRWEWVDA
ncbi:MAG: hypothetical protein WCO99_05585, partial [Planctomycetota bacterium]